MKHIIAPGARVPFLLALVFWLVSPIRLFLDASLRDPFLNPPPSMTASVLTSSIPASSLPLSRSAALAFLLASALPKHE